MRHSHKPNVITVKSTFYLLLLMILATPAAFAQEGEVLPKLSPLTRRYLQEARERPARQEQPGSASYIYKIGAGNALYVSALIKVGPSVDEDRLQALGVRVGTKAGAIWTVQVPARNVEPFTRVAGIDYIQLDEPLVPALDSVRKTTRVDSVHAGHGLPMPYTGANVVMGVVDAGFDYGHPTLFDTTGTQFRVKRVWEQKNSAGSPPAGYAYGTEMTDPAVMWVKGTDNGETHGTHVAGICGGSGFGSINDNRYRGIAYESDLVFVGITPDKSQWVNTGAADMIDGINYVFRYAESIGRPAVVNLSWGSPLGPRDGSGLFSQALDNLVGPGKIFVCSAGNNGDNKIHVRKIFTGADTLVQSFLNIASTPVGRRTWVDMWGDAGEMFCAKVSLYHDTAAIASTGFICLDDGVHNMYLIGSSGDTCFIDITTSASEFNGRPRIFMEFDSRISDSICIAVKGDRGTVDMWSTFVHNTTGYYSSFNSYGRPWAVDGNSDISISDIASTRSAITVGAYASKIGWTSLAGNPYTYVTYVGRGRLVPFSSHGPTVDGRVKPDITGPGLTVASAISSYDTSFSADGSDAMFVVSSYHDPIGGRDYPYGVLSGTSMSSPAVAGIVALMLQVKPDLAPREVMDIMTETAIHDNYTGQAVPGGTSTWGNGKVNGYGAVKRAVQLSSGVDGPAAGAVDYAIYPNPGTGLFSITRVSPDAENLRVELSDMLGNSILADTWSVTVGYNNRQYDLRRFGSGVYILKVSSRRGYSAMKIVVE